MQISKKLPKWQSLYVIFLHVALIVLCVEVFLLVKKNREFAARFPLSKIDLQVGDYFSLANLQPLRHGARVDTTKQQSLLFVFTSTCGYCKDNLELWKRIVEKTNGRTCIIGISLDSLSETEEFFAQYDLSFAVFLPGNAEVFRKTNKISSVPQTIIRNQAGIVEKLWVGRLSDDSLDEVFDVVMNTH